MRQGFIDIYRIQRRQILRFLGKDEHGGTNTIEFVLWLPIFVMIAAIVIDVCFMFLAQAVMFDVASDAVRRRAVGFYDNDAAASAFLLQNATFNNTTPLAANVATSGVEITATIQFRAADLDLTGILSFLNNDELSVQVSQLKNK